MKNLLTLTAVIEVEAGLVFVVSPSLTVSLLLGSQLDMSAAVIFERLAGYHMLKEGVPFDEAKLFG